jgi:23S rRNA (cytosine1962-C5)-methyltransferase
MEKCGAVYLKPGKEAPLLRGHCWVFSGAIAREQGEMTEGDLVQVIAADGEFLAWGHWHAGGSIRVRVVSYNPEMPDDAFWYKKLAAAFQKRQAIGLPNTETTCFRWVHGEGDQLPGLIVDVYGGHVVLQCHTTGMVRAAAQIALAVQAMDFLPVETIVLQDERVKTDTPLHFLLGDAREDVVLEHGLKYAVNWAEGQKTGFFLDQRINRLLLKDYAGNRKVLNAFSYSGGFSVTALAGGAREVHSVDISAKALDLAHKNVALNGFQDRHQGMVADVMRFVNDMDADYDVVILDPPAFAKRLDARHKAVQGYRNLNYKALRKMKSGSLLFTFSCSQVVDKSMFQGAVMAAGLEAGRQLSILHQLNQPADHPVNLYQPETEYLKGLVLYVE